MLSILVFSALIFGLCFNACKVAKLAVKYNKWSVFHMALTVFYMVAIFAFSALV